MAAKKKAPKKTAPKTPEEAQLSRFQTFTMARKHRRELRGAPYNPRVLSPEARKKLERALRDLGLLGPVTWNKRTGLVVGGHQRLAALDALHGDDNYLLDVAVIELDETKEREANVLLNNPNVAGDYDMDLLAELLKTPGLELEATGFDFADIQVNFDDPELTSLFAPNEPTKAALSDVEKQQKAADTKKRIQRERSEDNPAQVDRQDTEVMLCVIFRTRDERENMAERLGYARDERYVDGARLRDRLG